MTHYRDSTFFTKLVVSEGIPKEFLPNLDDNDSVLSDNNSTTVKPAPAKGKGSGHGAEKEDKKNAFKFLDWPLCCWICRQPIVKKRSFLVCSDVCKRSYHKRCHNIMKNHFQNMVDKGAASRGSGSYDGNSSFADVAEDLDLMKEGRSKDCSDSASSEDNTGDRAEQKVYTPELTKLGDKPHYMLAGPDVVKKCFFCSVSHVGCNGCRHFFQTKDLVKCAVETCSTFYCYPDCFSSTRIIIPDKKVIDINMSMCGHLHSLVDVNGRPKFICHSHTCWSCYDCDRYSYYWETFWRNEQTKEKTSPLVTAWGLLKSSCRGKVESSHFAKGKKIPKPQRYPEMRSFRSFIQSKPFYTYYNSKSEDMYNSSDDDEEYFQKGPSNVLLKCVRCDRTWCTHCVHPDVHILPRSGKQIVCHDCIHIQVGCTLAQNSTDTSNRENIMNQECIYPSIHLDSTFPPDIYKQLKNFIDEHASYERKLNLEPTFISKQPAQDSDDDNQILELHKSAIIRSRSRKGKKQDAKSAKGGKGGHHGEHGPAGGAGNDYLIRPFHDMKSREWNMIIKGCDDAVLSKISSEFRYITANVVSPENKKLIAAPDANVRCTCTKRCGPECTNVQKNVECTAKNCAMYDINCGNKRFANFLLPKLKLNYVEGKGIGAVATEDIHQNELVCEYVGEVISHSDFQKSLASSSFAEVDGDNQCHWYIMKIHKEMYIDSTHLGNVSRFINHSCDPNCASIPINVRGTYRMGVFALKKIPKGQEVTYNYGFTSKGVGGGFRCRCGAKNCRGIIGSNVAHSPDSLMTIEASKNMGSEADVLSQLTSDMASLTVANKAQSLLQQPSPLDMLNGIWTSGDLHRYEKILSKLDSKDASKAFIAKLTNSLKGTKNPLYTLLQDNAHVSEAQFNYVKMLTLNSMSMLEFDIAATKQFATNVPWAIVAMGHKDISHNVSMESSTGFFEFYSLAKRFIQISSMLVARHRFGKAACENIQDLMDLTWGGTEPCTACGGYGDCRWCDNCGNVLHDDNNCGDFYVNREGVNMCSLCQNSNHRYRWYVSSNMDREHMAMELWTIRMRNKVERTFDLLRLVCSRGSDPGGSEKSVADQLKDLGHKSLHFDKNSMLSTADELALFSRDPRQYYERQLQARDYCYEALTNFECYT